MGSTSLWPMELPAGVSRLSLEYTRRARVGLRIDLFMIAPFPHSLHWGISGHIQSTYVLCM